MAVTTLKNLEAAERRATAASSDTRRHPLRLRWGRPGSVPLDVDGVLGGDDLPPALLLGHHVDRPPLRLPLQWLPVVGHGALADVYDGHVGPYERDMHDLVGGGRVLHRAWQNLLRERVDFIPSGQPPASAGHPDCLGREQAHKIFDALLLLGLLQFGHPLLYGRHLRPPRSAARGLL